MSWKNPVKNFMRTSSRPSSRLTACGTPCLISCPIFVPCSFACLLNAIWKPTSVKRSMLQKLKTFFLYIYIYVYSFSINITHLKSLVFFSFPLVSGQFRTISWGFCSNGCYIEDITRPRRDTKFLFEC